jgi:subtilisin family serine protease
MKNKSILLAIIALLVIYFPWISAAETENTRYTVVFKGKGIPLKAKQIIQQAGGDLIKTFPKIGVGIAISNDSNFSDSLKSAPGIYSVGAAGFHSLPQTQTIKLDNLGLSSFLPPDFLYLNGFQWSIRRVKADQAWSITSGSHNTVVAVIDTGIAWNHSDLYPNVVDEACYSSTNSCTNYPDASYDDGGWHGTAVAGIIAAAFDEGAMRGVGPNLGLASYKVFEQIPPCGYCAYDESIWDAMLDATEQGYDVINLSLGGYVIKPESQEDVARWTAWNRLANYVTKQGVTIVASAGNDGFNLNGPRDSVPSDLPNVISVGATGIRPDPYFPQPGSYDVRPWYGNYGASVTLVAPGGDLGPFFTDPYYLVFINFVSLPGTPPFPTIGPFVQDYVPNCEENEDCPEGYTGAYGTSFSAPHVAGAAALLIDRNPDLKPNQVRSILKRTAENLGDRLEFGHGMLDVAAAVSE